VQPLTHEPVIARAGGANRIEPLLAGVAPLAAAAPSLEAISSAGPARPISAPRKPTPDDTQTRRAVKMLSREAMGRLLADEAEKLAAPRVEQARREERELAAREVRALHAEFTAAIAKAEARARAAEKALAELQTRLSAAPTKGGVTPEDAVRRGFGFGAKPAPRPAPEAKVEPQAPPPPPPAPRELFAIEDRIAGMDDRVAWVTEHVAGMEEMLRVVLALSGKAAGVAENAFLKDASGGAAALAEKIAAALPVLKAPPRASAGPKALEPRAVPERRAASPRASRDPDAAASGAGAGTGTGANATSNAPGAARLTGSDEGVPSLYGPGVRAGLKKQDPQFQQKNGILRRLVTDNLALRQSIGNTGGGTT